MNANTLQGTRRRKAGFTLIELMITCVILAIIVSIAVPAYTSQVRKARRSEARNAILDLAGREERWLSVSNTYSATPSDMGYSVAWPAPLLSGYYTVGVTVGAPATTFLITATAAGQQAGDTVCNSFTVDQTGQQKAYTSGAVDNTALCWGN